MSEKKNNVIDFVKRNAYYFVIGISLLIIATVIAIILATNAGRKAEQVSNTDNTKIEEPADDETGGKTEDGDKTDETGGKTEDGDKSGETGGKTEDGDKSDETGGKTEDGDKEDEDEQKPTAIIFTAPVSGGEITKKYTSSTVVFNKTLGVYTGHMGVDFTAAEGTAVVCAYAGTVEEIKTEYLKGTTVTVDHGNGLKTVYNSIEAADGLVKGMTLTAGQTIGYVSDNNRQEYKDGAHLHFEVFKDGVTVDPESYFALEGK